MRNILGPLQQVFGDIAGNISIIDNNVPVETQMEYYKYVSRCKKKEISEADFLMYELELGSSNLSKAKKKRILVTLAMTKQVRAYRVLEDYARHPDEGMTHWANMAVLDSRMGLETELSGEKRVYISTGMGGKDNKLRFYVLLINAGKRPLADYQQKLVRDEVSYRFNNYNCDLERLTFNDKCIEIVMLINIQDDIQSVIDSIIKECNVYGEFLSRHYLITNAREPSADELQQMVDNFREK
jgi:hypothetical protein